MKKIMHGMRAFTILELVIVIAVTAILAGVLIPVFSNVIGRANEIDEIASSRNARIQAIIDGDANPGETDLPPSAQQPKPDVVALSAGAKLSEPGTTYTYITNEQEDEVTFEIGDNAISRLVIDAPYVERINVKYADGADGSAAISELVIIHTAPSSTHISVCVSRLDLSDGRVVIESGALVERVAVLPTKNASATVELFSPTQIAATFKCNGNGTSDAICIIDHTDASSVVMEADDEAISHGTTTSLSLISSSENEVPFAVSDKNEAQSSFFEGKQISTTVTDGGDQIASLVTIGQEKIEQITISDSEITLDVGGTFTLTSAVLPEGVDGDIEWRSSDESVAKVDGGKVTALKLGSATISASVGGKSAICKVHIGTASVGGVYYSTFSDAVGAARDGDTLVLFKKATAAQTIVSKSFTLDLNGKTLSTTGTIQIKSTGGNTLTITDSSDDNSGTIISSVHAIDIKTKCALVVNGGSIRSTSTYGIKNNSGGTFTISGGYVYGAQSAIWHSGSKSYINGGTIDGGDKGIDATSNLKITGGTISSSGTAIETIGSLDISGEAEIIGSPAIKVKKGKLTQSGGTITGAIKET